MVSGADRRSLICTRRTGWEEEDVRLPVGEATELGLVEFLIWSWYRWYEGEFVCFLCPYFDFFLEVFYVVCHLRDVYKNKESLESDESKCHIT